MRLDKDLVPVFLNTNEDDLVYERHAEIGPAFVTLEAFPNDSIVIRLVTPSLLRLLTDQSYGLDSAIRDGITDQEYIHATQREIT